MPPAPLPLLHQAFAAAWQDGSRLLVGTKCNKLLQVRLFKLGGTVC